MIRVRTEGSVWLIDEDRHVYYRFPLEEKPRDSPPGEDWGGPGAGSLQDAVEHPYDSWEIVEFRVILAKLGEGLPRFPVKIPGRRLIIHGAEGGVDAPDPVVIDGA